MSVIPRSNHPQKPGKVSNQHQGWHRQRWPQREASGRPARLAAFDAGAGINSASANGVNVPADITLLRAEPMIDAATAIDAAMSDCRPRTVQNQTATVSGTTGATGGLLMFQ